LYSPKVEKKDTHFEKSSDQYNHPNGENKLRSWDLQCGMAYGLIGLQHQWVKILEIGEKIGGFKNKNMGVC